MTTQIETHNPKLEYLNSFAAIFEDGFLIHQHNPRIPIHVSKLYKVLITKRKKISCNWFLFLLSGLGSLCLYFNPMKSIIVVAFIIVCLVITLLMALFLKIYSYTFVIIFLEEEIVRIKLNKKNLNDAKQILKQMQKIIMEYKKKSIICKLQQ